jgi:hypothetical protein
VAVALLALDARARGLARSLDTGLWETALADEELYRERWLLSYEANVKGWLSKGVDHVAANATFGLLKSWGVSFYDSARYLDRPIQAPQPDVSENEGIAPEVPARAGPFDLIAVREDWEMCGS